MWELDSTHVFEVQGGRSVMIGTEQEQSLGSLNRQSRTLSSASPVTRQATPHYPEIWKSDHG